MSSLVYCIAQFKPRPGKEKELFAVLQSLEPNTLREEGCIQYRVTRHIPNPYADGSSFPIAFNEIWRDAESFAKHNEGPRIKEFFSRYCLAEDGLAEEWNVCVYTDEPEDFS
ncbi:MULTISPECIES: putative quinol monooxygenase [Marinobacterium]|uniref:Quinol monooxygenase YgiN n=2 Tax=Marinobacterium TaxID=48075 RepID=A0A1H5YZV4_9GAMM|nr:MULTISPECIES: putative quinol monooxygenase [Marinobacterium]TCK08257.1 quinol monooxygenase YgiN [Marinobacterium mangrovicola]SEG29544.1 Quinol monooxygenase YgiN [Marinobacterium lutimaris]